MLMKLKPILRVSVIVSTALLSASGVTWKGPAMRLLSLVLFGGATVSPASFVAAAKAQSVTIGQVVV